MSKIFGHYIGIAQRIIRRLLRADVRIYVVADTIAVRVRGTITSTHADSIRGARAARPGVRRYRDPIFAHEVDIFSRVCRARSLPDGTGRQCRVNSVHLGEILRSFIANARRLGAGSSVHGVEYVVWRRLSNRTALVVTRVEHRRLRYTEPVGVEVALRANTHVANTISTGPSTQQARVSRGSHRYNREPQVLVAPTRFAVNSFVTCEEWVSCLKSIRSILAHNPGHPGAL